MNQILAVPAELLARSMQLIHYVFGKVEWSHVRPSERGARASGRKDTVMPHLKSFAETQKGAFSKLTPEQKARIESRLSSSEEVMALHKRSQDRYDERNRIDKNSQTEFESFPSKKPL